MIDASSYETILQRRLEALEARIDKSEAALTAERSKDWEDQAIEREEDEVLEALTQHDTVELAQIRAAMNRIKAGTYGICVRCEEEISPARLTVLPATAICRDCAKADTEPFENMPV